MSPASSQTSPPNRSGVAPMLAHVQIWLWWTVLAVVGLALVVFGSLDAAKEQNSVARTAMVVAQMQAGIQSLSAEAMLAARGNPGSIDDLRESRAQVNTLRGLLRTGGYAASSDPAPVLLLDGRSGFPLPALDQALAGFDSQVRTLEESAGQLREAADAEKQLSQSLDSIAQTLAQVARVRELGEGQWGAALASPLGVLSRPEMRTMRVIFSPLKGAETLQSSWAQQFQKTAAEVARISTAAQSDARLSATAKAHLKSLASAVSDLSNSAGVLARTQEVRLGAQQLQIPIQEAVEAVQTPLVEVGNQVIALQSTRPTGVYLSWLGAVGVLAGLLGLIRATSVLGSQQWASTQETRSGHGLSAVVDRITRHLRRILSNDGSGSMTRLEEDPDAETFALASMINSLLESHAKIRSQSASAMDFSTVALSESSGPAGRIAAGGVRLSDRSQQLSAQARSMAQDLARMAQAPTALQAHRMVQMTTAAELVMQEGTFRMDAMRETVQTTSKRLKRLAEGAQSIARATTVIDEISRRVKVLSTNAAIEAAAHGEGGRKFAVLAKEIERLSQSAHEAAGDIGQVVKAIQVDAQETVAGMERSTAEVVASTELAAKAGQALREIEHASSHLASEIEAAAREVEKQALASVKVSQGCDGVAGQGRDLVAEAEALAAGLDRAKAQVRDAKTQIASL